MDSASSTVQLISFLAIPLAWGHAADTWHWALPLADSIQYMSRASSVWKPYIDIYPWYANGVPPNPKSSSLGLRDTPSVGLPKDSRVGVIRIDEAGVGVPRDDIVRMRFVCIEARTPQIFLKSFEACERRAPWEPDLR